MRDLLGGEFWLDIDPFSNREISISPQNLQNDLVVAPQVGVYLGSRLVAAALEIRWQIAVVYGLFASIEKVFNANHSLTLTAFGGPTQRATGRPTVQEAYDLAG